MYMKNKMYTRETQCSVVVILKQPQFNCFTMYRNRSSGIVFQNVFSPSCKFYVIGQVRPFFNF